MRESVLRAEWVGDLKPKAAPDFDESIFKAASPRPAAAWSPEDFARAQIVGLVREVFLANAREAAERPVRQVVFSAVDGEADVYGICECAGDALAVEAPGTVGVLAHDARALIDPEVRRGPRSEQAPGMPLRRIGARLRSNFWLVPPMGGEVAATASTLHAFLGEMRREFDYSIIEAPPAGESHDATAMAQFADGIILVLSAQRTRRVAARRVKEKIESAGVRVLGAVLSDRAFPLPNEIYRRL